MTPDIGYYIDSLRSLDFAHTLPGSFLACLPTGVIMLLFYYFSPGRSVTPFPPLTGRLSSRSARTSPQG